MANHSYPVEVQSDFLEKITRAKPVQAISELIWNSLDADATKVKSISPSTCRTRSAQKNEGWHRAIPRLIAKLLDTEQRRAFRLLRILLGRDSRDR